MGLTQVDVHTRQAEDESSSRRSQWKPVSNVRYQTLWTDLQLICPWGSVFGSVQPVHCLHLALTTHLIARQCETCTRQAKLSQLTSLWGAEWHFLPVECLACWITFYSITFSCKCIMTWVKTHRAAGLEDRRKMGLILTISSRVSGPDNTHNPPVCPICQGFTRFGHKNSPLRRTHQQDWYATIYSDSIKPSSFNKYM